MALPCSPIIRYCPNVLGVARVLHHQSTSCSGADNAVASVKCCLPDKRDGDVPPALESRLRGTTLTVLP